MPDDKPSLFAGLRDELGGLSTEAVRWFRAHWELARIEIEADLRKVRHLAIALMIAGVLALAVLPLWVGALAWQLRGWAGLGFGAWLVLFGLGLVLSAALGGLLAWRRFRRRYSGLQETLEELREDLVWLGEWTGCETARGDGENEAATEADAAEDGAAKDRATENGGTGER
jgi:hypothetical protein